MERIKRNLTCLTTLVVLSTYIPTVYAESDSEAVLMRTENQNQVEIDAATDGREEEATPMEAVEFKVDETSQEIRGESAEEIEITDEALKQVLLEAVQANGYHALTNESLATIETLDAEGLGISNLKGLNHLTQLRSLELSNNEITDLTPIQSIVTLEKLKLEANQIEHVESLANLTKLTLLSLRNNSVRDLSSLSQLTKLEKLDVRGNSLTSIDVVAHFSQLKELNLRENAVEVLTPIEQLTELIELNIHTNQISDISPLRNLTKLEAITMRRNQISDLTVLAHLPQLRDLNARDNQITSIEALRNHRFLTVRLNLRGNPGLTDFSPVASYYDQIDDVDFVIRNPGSDLADLDLLDGEARLSSLQKRLIDFNRFISDSAVRQTKLKLLGGSPLSFYRGSAHLFFEDIAARDIAIPDVWQSNSDLHTWITGDWHTENIGFYGNGKHEAVFDFNDFDEAAVAPFTYDLLRFGTSMYLLNNVSPGLQLTQEEMEEAVQYFASSYKGALHEVISGKIDPSDYRFTANELSGLVGSVSTEVSALDRFSELNRWTQVLNGKRTFDFSNTRLGEATEEEKSSLLDHWDTYLKRIDHSTLQAVNADYFSVKDVARRLDAGLGSLGTIRYYVLIEGETTGLGDDVILDVKSQLPSAVDRAGVSSTEAFPTHADRTLAGMKAMHNYPDLHWGALEMGDESFLVKERSAYKEEFDQSAFRNRDDFESFLFYSARAAAFAHTRASQTLGKESFAVNAHAFMEQDAFIDEFSALAYHYYGQTLKDHELYLQLYQAGVFAEEAFLPAPDDSSEVPEDGGEDDNQSGDAPSRGDADDKESGGDPSRGDADDKESGDDPSLGDADDKELGDDPSRGDADDKESGGNLPRDDSDDNHSGGNPSRTESDEDRYSNSGGVDKKESLDERGSLLPNTATSTLFYLSLGIVITVMSALILLFLSLRNRNKSRSV